MVSSHNVKVGSTSNCQNAPRVGKDFMASGISEFLTIERYPEVSVLGEKQKGLNSNSNAKHMKLSKEYM